MKCCEGHGLGCAAGNWLTAKWRQQTRGEMGGKSEFGGGEGKTPTSPRITVQLGFCDIKSSKPLTLIKAVHDGNQRETTSSGGRNLQ